MISYSLQLVYQRMLNLPLSEIPHHLWPVFIEQLRGPTTDQSRSQRHKNSGQSI